MKSPKDLRHILHENPEISFSEYETTKILEKSIKDLAKETKTEIKILKPLSTGLVVDYKINSGEYFIFRADIDALPIKEKTECAFISRNENMHACGHDIHMSVLYGFMKYAFENRINKNILFVFQPGEESGGGAKEIIDSGIFNAYNIKNAFALHVTDEYKKGQIATTNGVLFASAMEIDVEFFGKPAHIAFPYDGINAFDSLRFFLDSADKIPKDISNPVILGVGIINAGNVRNIIPSYSSIKGSIRAVTMKHVSEYKEKLEKILYSLKAFNSSESKITVGSFYHEVFNDKYLSEKFMKVLSEEFNVIDCGTKMTGEDFGFFGELCPSFMSWLGTAESEERFGLHSDKFLPGDDVIETGIRYFTEIIKNV